MAVDVQQPLLPSSGSNGAVAIPMDNRPSQTDFSLDKHQMLRGLHGGEESHRSVIERLLEAAVRNRDIDCRSESVRGEEVGLADDERLGELLGDTPRLSLLQWCAVKDWSRLASALLKQGADVNQSTPSNSWTLLIIASLFGSVQTVQLLLEFPDSQLIEKEGSRGFTAIRAAVRSRSVGCVKALVPPRWFQQRKGERQLNDALLVAAKAKDLEMVKAMIEAGADVNSKSSRGWPVLVECIVADDSPAVDWLLSRPGIDVNMETNTSDTPLITAVIHNNLPLMRTLLDQPQIDVNKVTKSLRGCRTALSIACRHGHREAAELLINSGSEIFVAGDATKKQIVNCFVEAIGESNVPCVELLLKRCPASFSKENWFHGQVELILGAGCDSDNAEIMQLILESDLLKPALDGEMLQRATEDAAKKGLKRAVKAILRLPNPPSIIKPSDACNGKTILHLLSASCLDEELCAMLRERVGFSPSHLGLKDADGFTVIDYMSCEQHLHHLLNLPPIHWKTNMDKEDPNESLRDLDIHTFNECLRRFPDVSQRILDCSLTPFGHGLHDNELAIHVDLHCINDNPIDEGGKRTCRDSQTMKTVASDRPELLHHPVMKLLIHERWRRFPRVFYVLQFGQAILLAVCFGLLVWGWKGGRVDLCLVGGSLILALLGLCSHLVEAAADLRQYCGLFNLFQCGLYLATLVSIIISTCVHGEEASQIQSDFHSCYSWTALLVFGLILNVLMVLRKETHFGLYIIMFTSSLGHFVRLAVPLLTLLGAFTLAFNILYLPPPEDPETRLVDVSGAHQTFMKMVSLAIGSVDADETGGGEVSVRYGTQVALFLLFVVFAVILTMNLLIGVVIADVKEALDHAQTTSLTLRVLHIYQAEAVASFLLDTLLPTCLPYTTVRKVRSCVMFDRKEAVVRPNRPQTALTRIAHLLDGHAQGYSAKRTAKCQLLHIIKQHDNEKMQS